LGEGYFPYLYQKRPDGNFDPTQTGNMAWDVYREMWGRMVSCRGWHLTCVEYADRLSTIKVPTLITVGDHDECDPSLAKAMHSLIPRSKLVILPKSGHMTFVDQPGLFMTAVEDFLTGGNSGNRSSIDDVQCHLDSVPAMSRRSVSSGSLRSVSALSKNSRRISSELLGPYFCHFVLSCFII